MAYPNQSSDTYTYQEPYYQQSTNSETHPSSAEARAYQSPYYHVDRSTCYTPTSTSSSASTGAYQSAHYTQLSPSSTYPQSTSSSSSTGAHQSQYYPVDRSAYYHLPSSSSTTSHSSTGAHQPQYYSQTSSTSPSSSFQSYNPMQRFENESMREQPWNGISEFQAMGELAKTERKEMRKEGKRDGTGGKGWSSATAERGSGSRNRSGR
ncbi:MAG: hypothetical protein Q9187_002015 [Circinaria calcarea]